jgi:hypothetical protein
MTSFRRLTLFYFINLVIFLLARILFGGHLFDLILKPSSWVVALIILIAGQIVGFFYFIAHEKVERKAKIFYNCALFTSIGFGLIILSAEIVDWKHQKDLGNIESNEDYFKYFVDQNKSEKKIAFDSLIKKFKDPNDIKIIGTEINWSDTTIGGSKDTIYFLKYLYNKNYKEGKFEADLTIFKNAAHVNSYDKLLTKSEEHRLDSIHKKGIHNLKEAIKNAPDSIRKIANDNFKEVLDP